MSPRPSLVPAADEFRGFCPSPTPYSQPSVGNLLQKFSDSERAGSYKKRAAPRPPAHNNNNSPPPWVKKGPAPPRPYSPARPQKSDPIKELESIGRKNTEEV